MPFIAQSAYIVPAVGLSLHLLVKYKELLGLFGTTLPLSLLLH